MQSNVFAWHAPSVPRTVPASAVPASIAGRKAGPGSKRLRKQAAQAMSYDGIEDSANNRSFDEHLGSEMVGTIDGKAFDEEQEGATSTEAMLNAVSILMGVGILSIPYALNEGGWATLGVLAMVWLSTNHTGKLLVKCQEYYNTHPEAALPPGNTMSVRRGVIQTYEDIAELAFGKRGRDWMTGILYTELIGTCSLFLILEKDHARIILDSVPQLSALSESLSNSTLMLLAAALFIPTTWLPDLSALSLISAAGMLASLGLTALVVYSFLSGQPHLADTAAVHLQSLPMTFGMVAFVFAGHAVFPIIYSSMKPSEQPRFPAVLDATYVVIGAVSLAIGAAGYLTYGSATLEEITMNLPVGPLQLLGTALILIAPFSKFALTLEPVAAGADSALKLERGGLSARGVRTGLGLFSLLLATRVPFFGTFMSLLGSFLTLTVSVMFPVGAYLKIHWDELSEREKVVNYAVLGLGAVCTVAGTVTALEAVLIQVGLDEVSFGGDALQSASYSLQQATGLTPQSSAFSKLVCKSLCELHHV